MAKNGVVAERKHSAPGVYIAGEKICSIGLRVRRGCSYHGLALNVDMDLDPFSRINPCGFSGLRVTSIKERGLEITVGEAADTLEEILRVRLSAEMSHKN